MSALPPPASTPPHGAPPLPARSWAARNLVWLIIGGVLAVVIGCGGCFGWVVWNFMGALRDHPAASEALARAAADPRVTAITGTPLEAGRFVTGQFSAGGGSGAVSLNMPVHGPSGSGWLRLDAAQGGPATPWKFNRLVFEPRDGPAIDLRIPPPAEPPPPGGS
ncbi:hypothetical protein PHYC_01532 [Phycisphaerales bacterium]|nr:hypothetical protein PHYC_01532 [Phycisphaerales bacterium]